jgi:hypothetical protein
MGYLRPPAAPLLAWVRELPLPGADTRGLLQQVIRSYYQTRFDPDGTSEEQGELFGRQIQALLGRLCSAAAEHRTLAR